MVDQSHPRPFERPGVAARTLPFAAMMLLVIVVARLPPNPAEPKYVVAAVGLSVAVALAGLLMPWRRLPAWAQAIPPLAYLGVVLLLRAGTGGAISGYGLIVVMPILWLGLHGTRNELLVALGVASAVLIAPILVEGAPRYPVNAWPREVVRLGVAAAVGLIVWDLKSKARLAAGRLTETTRADELTGLPNRVAWREALERELARARREEQPLCVAMLNLDDFARFVSERGRDAADRLVSKAATNWLAELRASDMLARYEREAFVVLLPNCAFDDADKLVGRLRGATPSHQPCSAGAVEWDGKEGAGDLLERAALTLIEDRQRRAERERLSPLT